MPLLAPATRATRPRMSCSPMTQLLSFDIKEYDIKRLDANESRLC